jgi:uncharacterized protein YkwD
MHYRSRLARLAVLFLGCVCATTAVAAEETQLVDAINAYRSESRACGAQVSEVLPPLTSEPLLATPGAGQDWQQTLIRSGYSPASVKRISLSGPADVEAVMAALQGYCQVLLDPQFVDIGVSRMGNDWRVVLARPLLTGRLADWQAEGQKLLAQINGARAQARQCGTQNFNAAPPLAWNDLLGTAAQSHSRAMANGNFFAHLDREGHTPGDRAELAGYSGGQVGENLAAGLSSARKVVDGWLGSPGHCANLMSPQFSELGAAYAVDPQSDAGIYWTALFGGS